jgi:hypothetical protein
VTLGKDSSGKYGLLEFAVTIQLEPISIGQVFKLSGFRLHLIHSSGGGMLGSSNNSTFKPSTAATGLASIIIAGIDADVSFKYDPAASGRFQSMSYGFTTSTATQLTVDISFPGTAPSIGSIIDDVVGQVTGNSHILEDFFPPVLVDITKVVELDVFNFTLTKDDTEGASWKVSQIYVKVMLSALADYLGFLGDEITFIQPTLEVTVNNVADEPKVGRPMALCVVKLANTGIGNSRLRRPP